MWLYEAPPMERLKKEFGFEPSAQWLEHLRLSSVHLGASASFVSANGLILTNHHVALGALQAVSRAGADYVKNGFLAESFEKEIKAPGYEATVLVSIEDVTRKVNDAVPANLPAAEAVKARHAVMATIERESEAATKLQSRVVSLYGGALYHLYRSKRYDDVRIVFAPELDTAFFGGDPDNFEYPRYCLDISLLRAYENGKPAKVEHWLQWSMDGVKDGELTFVSGHPGRTERLLPSAVLQRMRDESSPLQIENLERSEKVLLAYGAKSPEAHRQTARELFGVQNSLKAGLPRLAVLRNTDVIERKRHEEAELRAARDAFAVIDKAEAAGSKIYVRETMFEGGVAFRSRLFGYARMLVRMPVEDARPDDERLPEFNQSKRKVMLQRLLADDPVYAELEAAKMADSLAFLVEKLGASDPLVRRILAGKSPGERARELVDGCKLGDPDERRKLQEGGAQAIDASRDPMIELVRLVDPQSRQLRKEMETNVTEPQTQAMAEINKARFAIFGTNTYPDATGSLRLALGVVKGYEQDGQHLPPWTTIGGAFDHEREHGAKWPYELPEKWHTAKSKVNANTPLNFISTADITGGNSGSPVVNRQGEFVGIVFDSNRQGVVNDFAYEDRQARMIAVDSRGIIEALRKVYAADKLIEELVSGNH
jgi:hypothetical protein